MVYLCLFIAKIHLFEQMKCLILKVNNSTLYVFLKCLVIFTILSKWFDKDIFTSPYYNSIVYKYDLRI
ncbi:hypothetical protein DP198_21260 [Enterobacter hormaechei]|nr:hypothetical protein DP198_21260 [Enterobacter hormaechei]